jgi:hypothetical protein
MNLGKCDGLIDKDKYRYPDMRKMELRQVNNAIQLNEHGLEIQIPSPAFDKKLTLTADGNITWRMQIYNDQKGPIYENVFKGERKGIVEVAIAIPERVAQQGYSRIRLVPLTGTPPFILAGIKLTP